MPPQQSECYSQLGDTEKALSGLYALEALQKAEAAAVEEGGGGGGKAAVIPVHKVISWMRFCCFIHRRVGGA